MASAASRISGETCEGRAKISRSMALTSVLPPGAIAASGIISASLRDHSGSAGRTAVVDDRGGHHAVTGNEIRRQSSGNTEADDAAVAGAYCQPEQIGGFAAATGDKHARTRCDPRFEGKSDKSNHRSLRQVIEVERAVGVGQRPDRGRSASIHLDAELLQASRQASLQP